MAAQMAEYATLAVLHAFREADVYAAQQREARWDPHERRAKAEFGVGLLGCGVLGCAIAAALAPIGFPLAGWSRTRRVPPGAAASGPDEFASFLAASHALVCTLPLTPETTGLLDRAALSQLPRGAHVINVARGEIIVDADLLALLDEGHLGGATLDVFRVEPLPPEHAFWHHPRITVTPHVSAVTLIPESVAQGIGSVRARGFTPSVIEGNLGRVRTSSEDDGGRPVAVPVMGRIAAGTPIEAIQSKKGDSRDRVKIALIDRLTDAGFKAIEATAFVSPKWVPQMADAAAVMAGIRRAVGVRYPVLTPNMKGFEAALAAKADEVAVFVAASETFSRKNINCSIAESLERAQPIYVAAAANGIRVRGYISCVLGCPYEGNVDPAKVAEVAAALHSMGSFEVSLGDTIGVGTPGKTKALLATVAERVPMKSLAGHFHDTYGQALTNVYAAMEMGVATFDCSVAGLGGCPYAKGATGNLASEDVLYMLDGLQIETGVDMTKLRAAGQFISDALGRPPVSRVARALAAKSPLGTA